MGARAGNVASYAASNVANMYVSKARVSSVMASRRMRATPNFAEAVCAVDDQPGMSDEELFRILNDNQAD
jgi:hypothetical protein